VVDAMIATAATEAVFIGVTWARVHQRRKRLEAELA
jgi:hypothetical protein